jgi:flagellar basal-body rod modification protein FlgD
MMCRKIIHHGESDVMDVNQVSTQTPSQTSSPGSVAGSTSKEGKDTFLKLLVAQLEHQDPLSPMEHSDFTAQLAQFSSLEQMEAINANLNSLVAAQNAVNGIQAAELIGKQVTAQGNTTQVRGGSASPLQYSLANHSAKVTIRVFDQNGQVVQTIDRVNQPAGQQSISWQGTGVDQGTLPDGNYRFEVVAIDDAGNPVQVDTLMQGRVEEVEFDSNQAYLLVGGTPVELSTVVSVKDQL